MTPSDDQADPNEVAQALERELLIKRMQWQRAAEKHRATRTVTFVMLAVVIIGTLVGFMVLMSQLKARREAQSPGPTAVQPAP